MAALRPISDIRDGRAAIRKLPFGLCRQNDSCVPSISAFPGAGHIAQKSSLFGRALVAVP